MQTKRSDHGMELDGMFAGRNAGEFNYREIARSGNMGGSKAPVRDLPVLSGVSGLNGVDVTVDTSTILMGILAIGAGVALWYKFGR